MNSDILRAKDFLFLLIIFLAISCQSKTNRAISSQESFEVDANCDVSTLNLIRDTWLSSPTELTNLSKRMLFSCDTEVDELSKRSKKAITTLKIHSQKYVVTIYPNLYKKIYGQWNNLALKKKIIREIALALDHEKKYSANPEWRALGQWVPKKLPMVGMSYGTKTENKKEDGIEDKIRMAGPGNDFALFVSEFMTENLFEGKKENVKCFFPAKYRFIQNIFDKFTSPHEAVLCNDVESWINPELVDSLELLVSSPTSRSAGSLAGHVMMRVKMKSKTNDYENPDDPVIGMVANVPPFSGEMEQNILGLAGDYPAIVEVMRLGDKLLQNNYIESRDVRRFVLKFDREQIRKVLEHFYTVSKAISYDYVFFTNNCASLLIKQLATAIGDYKLLKQALSVGTPDTFTEFMVREGYAERVFPSFLGQAKKAEIAEIELNKIYLASPDLFTADIQTKLKSSDKSVRAAVYDSFRGKAKILSATDLKIVFRFLSLRRYIEDSFDIDEYNTFEENYETPFQKLVKVLYKNREQLTKTNLPEFKDFKDAKFAEFMNKSQAHFYKLVAPIQWKYEQDVLLKQLPRAQEIQTQLLTQFGLLKDKREVLLGKLKSLQWEDRVGAYLQLKEEALKSYDQFQDKNVEIVFKVYTLNFVFERLQELQELKDKGELVRHEPNYGMILDSFYVLRRVFKLSDDPTLKDLPQLDKRSFFLKLTSWRLKILSDDITETFTNRLTLHFKEMELADIKKAQIEIARKLSFPSDLVDQMQSLDEKVRSSAYQFIIDECESATPEKFLDLYDLALYSYRLENEFKFLKSNEMKQTNLALASLRKTLIHVLNQPAFKQDKDYDTRSTLVEAEQLYIAQEKFDSELGTARTGIAPISISYGTAFVNWRGVPQLIIDTSKYQQSIGDPSRFIVGKNNIGLNVLPSRMIVTIDNNKIDLSGSSSLFEISNTSEKNGKMQTLWDGKVGFSAKLLHYERNRWGPRTADWAWINPNLLVTLMGTKDFMNYVNLSIGLEAGTSYSPQAKSNWIGTPIALDAQINLDKKRNGQISMHTSYDPRWHLSGGMDQNFQTSVTGTFLLGNVKKTEVRLLLAGDFESLGYKEYLALNQKTPQVFRFSVGVKLRFK